MSERPFILLTNDDGYKAPGLLALKEALATVCDYMMVAPAENRSGFSHSITLMRALKLTQHSANEYALDGSPVDCVLFALRQLTPRIPDYIVSGINRGPNLGDDTLYSGTVGAALSGFLHGIPSLAFSLAGLDKPYYYDTAAEIALRFMKSPKLATMTSLGVLNVNVPNTPLGAVRGIRVTTMGRRHYDQGFEKDTVEGDTFWYGSIHPSHDGVPGTDSSEVDNGYAAVSVLRPSFFDAEKNEELATLIDHL